MSRFFTCDIFFNFMIYLLFGACDLLHAAIKFIFILVIIIIFTIDIKLFLEYQHDHHFPSLHPLVLIFLKMDEGKCHSRYILEFFFCFNLDFLFNPSTSSLYCLVKYSRCQQTWPSEGFCPIVVK